MCKSDFIEYISKKAPYFHKSVIEKAVNLFFDTIAESLVQNKRVELRGFGTFSVREREARVAHNPSSSEKVYVDAKRAPLFRAGKKLREDLNS